MRVWILIGGGILIVVGAIWPFGKRTHQLGPVPAPPAVAVQTPPAESPKPAPARVIEVIDLARAYEPVREPEEPAGTINPASFIQIPEGPQRIPPAIDLSNPYHDVLSEKATTGSYLFGVRLPGPERINVMPREVVSIHNGELKFVYTPRPTGQLVFTPMGQPFAVDVKQPIPPNASIENGLLNFTPTTPKPPAVGLDVMPRVVPAPMVMEQPDGSLVRYWPSPEVAAGTAFTPMSIPYAVGITQPIPPNASIRRVFPLEEIKVMPRVVPEPMSPAGQPLK